MEADPPTLPGDHRDGWTETDRSVETAFDAKLVTVEAHTVVYDDHDLRAAVRETTGIDRQWRFVLASRLRLSPRTETSRPLTRLVTDRARSGFRDRLADRGFEQLRRTDTATRDRNGVTAREATYDALLPLESATLDTRARVAVWPGDREYLLAGGGYPTGVREADASLRAPLTDAFDADAFRRELDELIAAVA